VPPLTLRCGAQDLAVGDALRVATVRHAATLFRPQDSAACSVVFFSQWSGCCRGAQCASLCEGEQAALRCVKPYSGVC
jgi:hypothetical protein